jgi:hypothetical protein
MFIALAILYLLLAAVAVGILSVIDAEDARSRRVKRSPMTVLLSGLFWPFFLAMMLGIWIADRT